MNTDSTDTLTGPGARRLMERMGEAAVHYLASLTPDQRAKGVFAREGDIRASDRKERTRWYYTPVVLNGLPLAEMDRHQPSMASSVVSSPMIVEAVT